MQAASPPERLFGGRIAPGGRVASRLGSEVEAPGDLLRQGHGYDLFNGGPILFGGLDQSPPLVGAVAERQVLADQVAEFGNRFSLMIATLRRPDA
jgi:hypothetical protein